MLPLSLTLKNFMSYGDEPATVDLRGLSVVCLSGDNGHGKSALLDAITWALWGETRMGRQNHEQLIRLGADEMSVVLEFAEGESVYRVRRQRSMRSGGQIWELQIAEPGGTWRPITGQGSADTSRAIVHLLRMNYETFLNSAYLRQGRADEFVRLSANKRKDILAEILDLSRYDDLEAGARQRAHEAAQRALDASRDIQQIDAILATEQEHREALARVDELLADHATRENVASTRLEQLGALRATLAAQRQRTSEAQERLATLVKQIDQHHKAIAADRAVLDAAQHLLNDRERIEGEYARYESAQQEIEALQECAASLGEMEKRREAAERQIEQQRNELRFGLKSLEKQRDGIVDSLAGAPNLEQRIALLSAAQSRYEALAQRRKALWDDQQELTARFETLRADRERADRDLSAQTERLASIESQGEACSVCGAPLPPDRIADLFKECEAQIALLKAGVSQYNTAAHEVKRQRRTVELDLETVGQEIVALEERRDELTGLQQRLGDLNRLRGETLPSLEKDIAVVAADLAAELFGMEARKALGEIAPMLDAARNADRRLKAVLAEINTLRWADQAHARLQTAQRESDAAASRIDQAQQSIALIERQRAETAQAVADAPALDHQIAVNEAEIDSARVQIRALAAESQNAQRDRGRLHGLIEQCDAQRTLRSERVRQHQSAKNDEDLYTLLAASFSKRGVQALIIENALPELEQDANELLQRLTDGQMSVTIQTTRQAKGRSAGDAPIETLSIVIGDQMGTRPLEMYSGGESFRVSFALRIALSKLLARRAGAHLQTLIIDEGFGTQDAKGREKLVDAIMAIQAEFAQIIVITHIDDLRDAFPNRIEVVKKPTGSEATVMTGASLG